MCMSWCTWSTVRWQAWVPVLVGLLVGVPVGIALATDVSAKDIRVNRAFADMLAISPSENASKSRDDGAR